MLLKTNVLCKLCTQILSRNVCVVTHTINNSLWRVHPWLSRKSEKVINCYKVPSFKYCTFYDKFGINEEKFSNFIEKLININWKDKEKKENVFLSTLPPSSQIFHALEQVTELNVEKAELLHMKNEADDEGLKKLADEDIKTVELKILQLYKKIVDALLNSSFDSAITEITVEVSAGVGGQEAMLFAEELFEMYHAFCLYNGWQVDIASCETTTLGGIRQGSLIISGETAYEKLKFEGGIHRVQRVPKTEKTGRIHTSTASVAVLPQPSEITVQIEDKDLKIETMRSSGAGGQHVNTTDSAVRLTHIPSGVAVECQICRSQDKNRKEALRKLRSRLYQDQLEKQEAKYLSQRKLQIGSKSRSEKIRTYNYSQDRVTDHRLSLTIHNVSEILSGGSALENLIDHLVYVGRKEKICELLEE